MKKQAVNPYFRDPSDYLRAELSERETVNPRYSMRAYARDLGLSPSTLSEVIAGRYGLSRGLALKVGVRLNLSKADAEDFADLFEAKYARNPAKKAAAAARITQRRCAVAGTVTTDAFRLISDWYHLTILEIVSLADFKNDIAWVAKNLGISKTLTEDAVGRLQRLGLLKIHANGKWEVTEDFTAVGNHTPSQALRRFHKQVLEKALLAIDFQSFERREISSTVFAVKRSNLNQARAELKKFRQRFAMKYSAQADKDAVYCLAIQLFDLLDSGEKNS